MPRGHLQLSYEPDGRPVHRLKQISGRNLKITSDNISSNAPIDLSDVAIFPEPGDNCAIAKCEIKQGTVVLVGSKVEGSMRRVVITSRILEGHRFAVDHLPCGSLLLSWGLGFGKVTAKGGIAPGEYLSNSRMLHSLKNWGLEGLPEESNFDDYIAPYDIKDAKKTQQVPMKSTPPTFLGYPRPASRGYGTRNYIIVIATSVWASPFVSTVTKVYPPHNSCRKSALLPGLDGIVPIAHTETGERENRSLLIRTLVNYAKHPNVGAAIFVDKHRTKSKTANQQGKYGILGLEDIKQAIQNEKGCVVKYLRVLDGEDGWRKGLQACRDIIGDLIPRVAAKREPCPTSGLSLALQCGGSDAFSGVSGNPVAGWAAKGLIEWGGKAILAETDELIGAESYILKHVKDIDTAKRFQECVQKFRERMSWHGQTAEANPSGGNNLRGLYNIALKSLGAAKKKHKDVRLDGVLEYSETAPNERGYYFMDSPGNDLESIAGQVGSGCNLVVFITGNGSITNFPFVPTIKVMTTSRRFGLLSKDMDFNAGRFQDGTPISTLGNTLLEDLRRTASGHLTKGEKAKHSQISIWRSWAQSGPNSSLSKSIHKHTYPNPNPKPTLTSLSVSKSNFEHNKLLKVVENKAYYVEAVGLIFPTSLCSGQIAQLIADELNEEIKNSTGQKTVSFPGIKRFIALPHTEGCGSGYAFGEEAIYDRVVFGHVFHPCVRACLMLEHGCEKMHNAAVKKKLDRLESLQPTKKTFTSTQNSIPNSTQTPIPTQTSVHELKSSIKSNSTQDLKKKLNSTQTRTPLEPDTLSRPNKYSEPSGTVKPGGKLSDRLGFLSVQLDGGIQSVREKSRKFFLDKLVQTNSKEQTGWVKLNGSPCIGVGMAGGLRLKFPVGLGETCGELVRELVIRGFRVVIPSPSPLLSSPAFLDTLFETQSTPQPSLAYAQRPPPGRMDRNTSSTVGGLYIMAVPSSATWGEVLTGLSGAGCVAAVAMSARGACNSLSGHPFLPIISLHHMEPTLNTDQKLNRSPFTSCTASGWSITATLATSEERSASIRHVCELVCQVLSPRPETKKTHKREDVMFQIPRGETGVSA
ncbi:hypothetical protein AAMO2058_000625900 [Amorphochlora amoebiformis]